MVIWSGKKKMLSIRAVGVVIVTLSLCVSCKQSSIVNTSDAQEISQVQKPIISVVDVTTFESGISKENVQLVDVRTDKEWKSGHLKNAQNFQINNPKWEEQIATLDKEKPVYVYCAKGVRSARSAKKLKKAGFTQIIDLDGGIVAWEEAGKPIEY